MEQTKIFRATYSDCLNKPQWEQKRSRILARDGYKCVICGSTQRLCIHHKQYHTTPNGEKYMPWCYDDKYLVTLCASCHSIGHTKYKVPIFSIKTK